MTPRAVRIVALACLLITAARSVVRAGVDATVHNLSPGGPGRLRAGGAEASVAGETNELCVFCHTPHNTASSRGLWSRSVQPVTYKLYESSTTEAELQQPTGSSRLCLSCHDGMTALGAPKAKAGSGLGRLTGAAVLGTDLSDDHPISFVYDHALVTRRPGLADPASLTGTVKLDNTGQVQCTSCHDPHIDRQPKFIVTDLAYSGLCVACHRLRLWPDSVHATSPATARGSATLPGWGFITVSQNGCSSCHRTHGAEHPVRLLRAADEEEVCFACHDGHVAEKDLRREFLKPSAHRVEAYRDVHDPTENLHTMPPHVECGDCHDAHQTRVRAVGGQLPGPLTGVSGADIGGSVLREAHFEYEVCLKCHGVSEFSSPSVVRVDNVPTIRLEIDPRNRSFHPIADVGRNPQIRGLIPPLTPASRTSCTSCHNSDAGAGPSGATPRGPHGSIYKPLLINEYRLDRVTGSESFQVYALCYGCHERTILLDEHAEGFPHRSHVVDIGASCAVCHDPHGSRTNEHLINFMLHDQAGIEVATPSSSGSIQYQSFGPGSGECSLTCHGKDHDPRAYGPGVHESTKARARRQ